MEAKRGDGLIFVNCMEKLTMNSPKETLRTRLSAALDAGIDGITLSAGLHLGSFALIADHPRFRDAKLGIIVSSVRALQLFLRKNARLDRLPDYIIVEGPLAGGHLGFGMDDWAEYDLHTIMDEIHAFLKPSSWHPADRGRRRVHRQRRGGLPRKRRGGVQVATRFTITHECGLPEDVKQEYVRPTRTTSSSTASRRPATRCACSRARRRSAPASARAANPTATCSTPPATAPTSTPTTAK
jgi:nitronate monooxygenase